MTTGCRRRENAEREALGIVRHGSLESLIARERRRVRHATLPRGAIVAADPAASRLIGPRGSIACSRPLLVSLAALADGECPVADLVAAGSWEDAAVLEAAAGAFELRLAAVGLRLVRGEAWGLEMAAARSALTAPTPRPADTSPTGHFYVYWREVGTASLLPNCRGASICCVVVGQARLLFWGTRMQTKAAPPLTVADEYASRLAVALSNIRWFRQMAHRASRDGLPKADLRAANARAAARIVLTQAKREARQFRQTKTVLFADAGG